jgi:hypothetical protein
MPESASIPLMYTRKKWQTGSRNSLAKRGECIARRDGKPDWRAHRLQPGIRDASGDQLFVLGGRGAAGRRRLAIHSENFGVDVKVEIGNMSAWPRTAGQVIRWAWRGR